jgi:hypothetical protein
MIKPAPRGANISTYFGSMRTATYVFPR